MSKLKIVNYKRFLSLLIGLSLVIGMGLGWFLLPTQTITEVKEIEKEVITEVIKYDTIDFTGETYTVTAYCDCVKCCGIYSDGITASGTRATQGRTLAVDRAIIPLGSKVVVEGFTGVMVAEDTGNPKYMSGKRIDIYFNSNQEALNFGVKELKVWVLN